MSTLADFTCPHSSGTFRFDKIYICYILMFCVLPRKIVKIGHNNITYQHLLVHKKKVFYVKTQKYIKDKPAKNKSN